MLGGTTLSRQGRRAVPSLTYLERQPTFSIGPDKGDDDHVIDLAQMAAVGQQTARATKTAGGAAIGGERRAARRTVLGRPRRHTAGAGAVSAARPQ